MSNEGPDWWNPDLRNNVIELADDSYPNEFIGLFVLQKARDRSVGIKSLAAQTVRQSADDFFVSPQAVINAAYAVEATNGILLGTVHSHPRGRNSFFSDADGALRWWGDWHLLCVMTADTYDWDFVWGTVKTDK
ncbi:Mov34/MPN/PAD-1 family protein [Alicyclobacillus sp. SO9]|uniref:Mov34/MPN/PAD-1 family protein n=1 Tax=Alicyclobacillus sp. SO9 TaxID=2665646 RepID=UPI0018E78A60|nr:Mov34/MPN/PAD-1 family protein [Alicyclobacillus sp. SO9]QQE76997.1 Mov34/MPN/PAD-1 family protein [Alicyclobacillus sp. SO9]